MNHELYIDRHGMVRFVANESLVLDGIGEATKRRASHVWPVHPVKRFAFRILRRLFGERGRVACWCRTWRGPWQVRFADNPRLVVFAHQSRRVCIAWEIATLNQRLSHD